MRKVDRLKKMTFFLLPEIILSIFENNFEVLNFISLFNSNCYYLIVNRRN